jgi:hypothetical protein
VTPKECCPALEILLHIEDLFPNKSWKILFKISPCHWCYGVESLKI